MIYCISDTHFGHKNIIQYENRPFENTDIMDAVLIENWNTLVDPDDIVIHLGDVGLTSASRLREIVSQLNGHKILVRGNHDTKSRQFYLDCGFEEVRPAFIFEYRTHQIFFSHRPESEPGDKNLPYDLHLFGHIHSKMADVYPTITHNSACLCVERWDYSPVPLDMIIALCETYTGV